MYYELLLFILFQVILGIGVVKCWKESRIASFIFMFFLLNCFALDAYFVLMFWLVSHLI